jgi:cation:H+ antiporter
MKDTLALGNITGAMVFQSSVIPALGIALIPLDIGAIGAGQRFAGAGFCILAIIFSLSAKRYILRDFSENILRHIYVFGY